MGYSDERVTRTFSVDFNYSREETGSVKSARSTVSSTVFEIYVRYREEIKTPDYTSSSDNEVSTDHEKPLDNRIVCLTSDSPALARQPSPTHASSISATDETDVSYAIEEINEDQEESDYRFLLALGSIISKYNPINPFPTKEFSETSHQGRQNSISNCNNWIENNPHIIPMIYELDLSRMGLKEIPSQLSMFTCLTELNLSHNDISVLPDILSSLKSLKRLNLEGNLIAYLPPYLSQFKYLRTLNLSGNQITKIPEELSLPPKLSLDDIFPAEKNFFLFWKRLASAFESLPKELVPSNDFTCSQLHIFNLYLEKIRPWIINHKEELGQIKALDLSGLSLERIPPELFHCTGLEELDLSSNENLSMLPDSFDLLSRLKKLSLSKTGIHSPPSSVVNHPLIEPRSLFSLEYTLFSFIQRALDSLSIPHRMTHFLSHTSDLRLYLRSKPFSYKQLMKMITSLLPSLPSVTTLDLSGLELDSLPKPIFLCKNLKHVDLSHNELTRFPTELLDRMPGIQSIKLSGNPIEEIPNKLREQPRFNLISMFPEEYKSLIIWKRILETIHDPAYPPKIASVSTTDYQSFRKCYSTFEEWFTLRGSSLKEIKELDLSHLNLKEFPSWLENFNDIESLNLSGNPIDTVPDYVANYKKLKEVNLSFTPFKAAPLSLAKHPNLANHEFFSEERAFLHFWNAIYPQLTKAVPDSIRPKIAYDCVPIVAARKELKRIEEFIERTPFLLDEITEIDLSHTSLSVFPEIAFGCKNVRRINLKGNRISKLTDRFSEFSKLESIDLSDSPIKKLPPSLEKLAREKDLSPYDIVSLRIIERLLLSIPNTTSHMPAQHRLNLPIGKMGLIERKHHLDILKEWIKKHPETIERISSLDLSGLNIEALPSFLSSLKGLKVLVLDRNNISTIPPWLADIPSLMEIDLFNNPIDFEKIPKKLQRKCNVNRVPVSITPFSSPSDEAAIAVKKILRRIGESHPEINIEELEKRLSENPMDSKIFGLLEIFQIDLSGLGLTAIPPFILSKKLKKLDVSNNEIETLPSSLWDCKELTSLDVSDNQLIILSPKIERLKFLEEVDVSDNLFSELPLTIPTILPLKKITAFPNDYLSKSAIKEIEDFPEIQKTLLVAQSQKLLFTPTKKEEDKISSKQLKHNVNERHITVETNYEASKKPSYQSHQRSKGKTVIEKV